MNNTPGYLGTLLRLGFCEGTGSVPCRVLAQLLPDRNPFSFQRHSFIRKLAFAKKIVCTPFMSVSPPCLRSIQSA